MELDLGGLELIKRSVVGNAFLAADTKNVERFQRFGDVAAREGKGVAAKHLIRESQKVAN